MVKGLRFCDETTCTRPLQVCRLKIAKQVRGGGLGLEARDGMEVGCFGIDGGGVADPLFFEKRTWTDEEDTHKSAANMVDGVEEGKSNTHRQVSDDSTPRLTQFSRKVPTRSYSIHLRHSTSSSSPVVSLTPRVSIYRATNFTRSRKSECWGGHEPSSKWTPVVRRPSESTTVAESYRLNLRGCRLVFSAEKTFTGDPHQPTLGPRARWMIEFQTTAELSKSFCKDSRLRNFDGRPLAIMKKTTSNDLSAAIRAVSLRIRCQILDFKRNVLGCFQPR